VLNIEPLLRQDIDYICTELSTSIHARSMDYLLRCKQENANGHRITLVATHDEKFTGYGHLIFKSEYEPFRQLGIPEINDLLVMPQFRNQGIGSNLISALERCVSEKYSMVGLGVGLYGYGAAQRIYVNRGYVPDGNGIVYKNVPVEPGATVTVDDDLLLYLVKRL
jgi:GNAT superfamily N-acetyltransferase